MLARPSVLEQLVAVPRSPSISGVVAVDSTRAVTVTLFPDGDDIGTGHSYIRVKSIVPGIVLDKLGAAVPRSPSIGGVVAVDSELAAIMLRPDGDDVGTGHGYIWRICNVPGIVLDQLVAVPRSPSISGVVAVDSMGGAVILTPDGDDIGTGHGYICASSIVPGIVLDQLVAVPRSLS